MLHTQLTLIRMSDNLSICRLSVDENIPSWAISSAFFSITKTADEISLVVQQDIMPEGIKAERDYRALKIKGPLDFGLTGILSSLLAPLAQAHIPVFVISTYDTDYILVKNKHIEEAMNILGTCCIIE